MRIITKLRPYLNCKLHQKYRTEISIKLIKCDS
jgi:hypothetical protein